MGDMADMMMEAEFWDDGDELVVAPGEETWRCKDGTRVLMKNMAPSHLANAIRYFNRHLKGADKSFVESAGAVSADITDVDSRERLKEALGAIENAERCLAVLHREKTRRGERVEELKRIRVEADKDVFE